MSKIEIKFTEVGKNYWENNGAYQEEYYRLWSELVPSRGSAKTVNGEMLRAIGRLTHDFYNNGNGNVVEMEREDCDEAVVTPYYRVMLDFLSEFVKEDQEVKQLEKFILYTAEHEGDICIYDEDKCHIYTELTDSIVYQILKSEWHSNEPNPYYVKP